MTNPLAPAWLTVPDDVNGLDPKVWPSTAARDADGALTVGGISAQQLLAEYGSPLYVVDEADARGRAARTVRAFNVAAERIGTNAKVYYAGKAFLTVAVARWMAEEGLAIDTSTEGELTVALTAGVDPARIGLHGNNKSDAELELAVTRGVGAIVADSLGEIDRIAAVAERHGVVQGVRVRVNTGVHAHTHEYLATAREDQKFGIPLTAVAEAVAAIRASAHLRFLGLHGHIGSQIFGAAGFAESAARLLLVHADLLAGGEVPELNLGGGFGIAYLPGDDPTPIEDLADALADIVARECQALEIPVPAIAVEPGRSIIGPAGITLYTVGEQKDVEVPLDHGGSATRRYVSVDGGMSDNARPALYEADYHVRLASRRSDAEPALVRVVGKHCESGDIVVQHDWLPADLVRGDILAVAATGAYCWSLASNYNYLGRPAVVAVRDGSARTLVRRETIADLLRRDGEVPLEGTPA